MELAADWLSKEPGGRDFAEVYLSTMDEMNARLEAQLVDHRVFGPFMKSMTPEMRAASQKDSRERIEKAFAGDWSAYLEGTRRDGAMYAAMGITFADWYEILGLWSRSMVPIITERYGGDAKRLASVLVTMHLFLDAAMGAIGQAYIDTWEAQVRSREDELSATLESIADAVIASDSTGKVARLNPAAVALLGVTADAARGQPLDELVRLEAEADGATDGAMVLRAGDAAVHVLASRSAIRREAGGSSGEVIVLHDLSERKRMEALQARGAQLEQENRRIEEASRLKSEFLANMSHELRTPLNSILGFSELLHTGEVGPLSDQQREFVGDIHNSGKHLLRLINDVLDLSKIEAGKLEFHPERVEVRSLLQEVTNVLKGVAMERGVGVDVDLDPALVTLHLDPARLKQVLYNYLSNAIKFTSDGGRVRVTLRPEGGAFFRIDVRDEGPGIAPADLSRLFVEFEQLDAGRAKTHGGTGLGLALTRRLVEAQGGTVGVTSELGNGSTFSATLPLRATGRTAYPKPRRIQGATPDASRILVIEDDPVDQEKLITALVGAGFAVDTAMTGAQALRAIAEHKYDAVTLDLLLPDTNGLEVLTALRASASQHAPVIVVSVVTEKVTGGFVVHDVLEKPLDGRALVESLARAGLSPPAGGPILVVDDDEPSAKLAAAALAQLGYRATIARDGEDALARAAEERPSAVVLDLVMPNMDGFGFLERFRADARFANVPVLVWTVKDLSSAESSALLRKAEAVLPKDGAGARALVERLRGHLLQRERQPVTP